MHSQTNTLKYNIKDNFLKINKFQHNKPNNLKLNTINHLLRSRLDEYCQRGISSWSRSMNGRSRLQMVPLENQFKLNVLLLSIKNNNRNINFVTSFSRHGNLKSLTLPSSSPVASFIGCDAK